MSAHFFWLNFPVVPCLIDAFPTIGSYSAHQPAIDNFAYLANKKTKNVSILLVIKFD